MPAAAPVRQWLRAHRTDVIDVFVYVVVLALEDLLFGEAVSLGGFFSVTGLIVVLLLARAAVRWLLAEEVVASP